MTEDDARSFILGMLAGMLIFFILVAVIMTGSTKGDVIELGDTSYVGIRVNDRVQWFEFDPTQPITFEKVATVGESK